MADAFVSESICQDCGQVNPVWHAPNPIWNEVVEPRELVLCPPCFIVRATKGGRTPRGGWLLVPAGFVPLPGPGDHHADRGDHHD